mmetsp:Transcript_37584/g.72032  ORF Transcript_37584/g.72032 Transcript_37584/m.72032 type:complete len:241 (+) Transcript_37584:434-1156(+)
MEPVAARQQAQGVPRGEVAQAHRAAGGLLLRQPASVRHLPHQLRLLQRLVRLAAPAAQMAPGLERGQLLGQRRHPPRRQVRAAPVLLQQQAVDLRRGRHLARRGGRRHHLEPVAVLVMVEVRAGGAHEQLQRARVVQVPDDQRVRDAHGAAARAAAAVGSARLKQALEVGPEHGDEVLVEIRFVRGGAVQGPGRGGEALQGGQGGRRARGAAVDVRAHLDAHRGASVARTTRSEGVYVSR